MSTADFDCGSNISKSRAPQAPSAASRLQRGMQASVRLVLGLFALAASVAAFAQARAPTPARPVSQIKTGFVHTAWTSRDGAPLSIWSIAQAPDGWLWLGTPTGLYRFDGVDFERVDPEPEKHAAPRSVRSVFAATNGDLWIGFSSGGARLFRHADPGQSSAAPGLPPAQGIQAFFEDGVGHIWAASQGDMFEFRGDRWGLLPASLGLPEDGVRDLALDAGGRLWASTPEKMMVLDKGSTSFRPIDSNSEPNVSLVFGQAGEKWTFDGQQTFRVLRAAGAASDPLPASRYLRSPQPGAQLAARDGSLWTVACPKGLCRYAPDASEPSREAVTLGEFVADSFGKADGLSSDVPMTLYEDQEGTIWVGTKLGLDSFRQSAVWRVPFPKPSIQFAFADAGEGAVWIGTDYKGGVKRNPVWRVDSGVHEVSGFDRPIGAMFRDADGAVLVAGRQGVWKMEKGTFTSVPPPPFDPEITPRFIGRTSEGDLWMAVSPQGLYRQKEGRWVAGGGIDGVPATMPLSIATDTDGSLWAGYPDGSLVRVHSNRLTRFDGASGLSVGRIMGIVTSTPMMVAGRDGIAFFDGKRFAMLRFSDSEILLGITGMVRSADRSIWISSNRGLARLDAASVDRAVADSSYEMPARVFDADDGMLEGVQTSWPSLFRSGDDALWVGQLEGVVRLDPRRLPHNELPPPVTVRSLTSGERRFEAVDGLRLPAATRDVRFQFTALSLAVPRRVQFRVKLEGVDQGWKANGNRREISYSNLGPGHYRFSVVASNDDGVWNDAGKSVSFDIAPTFYETWWFVALSTVAVLALLVSAQRWQIRRVARSIAAREEERAGERERVSRDLHDSLLQDMGALVLNLRGLQDRKAPVEAIQADLKDLGRTADRLLSEARERVTGLRGRESGTPDLAAALQLAAEQLHVAYPTPYRVRVHGPRRPLRTAVADEFALIGREALSNAFRHAKASHVEVSIRYLSDAFELVVTDDGTGFDESPTRPDHWGLIGMRERATHLRATLTIERCPGGGTLVRARLGASLAYR